MTTAIRTPSCPCDIRQRDGHNRLQQLWRTVRSYVGYKTNASIPDSVASNDPWSTAVNQVQHLDPHVLDDIGAPRWVIDEVNRRQQQDGILDINRKW